MPIQYSLLVLLNPGFVSIALALPRWRETLNVACHSHVNGFTARLKWSADILSASVRSTLSQNRTSEGLFALRAQADKDVRAPVICARSDDALCVSVPLW
jgi:hypothetical protein